MTTRKGQSTLLLLIGCLDEMMKEIKKCLLLLAIIFLSCDRQLSVKNTPPDNSAEAQQEPEWLIIGGQRVRNFERHRVHDYYLNSEIDNIEGIGLFINPKDETRATNLEGIEQVKNLRSLTIWGWNLDILDYSPINLLQNLNDITFESRGEDKLTRVPVLRDTVARESMIKIVFTNCALTNMDNIEYLSNLRYVEVAKNYGDIINIEALNNLKYLETLKIFSTDESVYKIEEITSLARLSHLYLDGKLINIKGIENLSSLEHIDFSECNVINTRYLSMLKNVKYLYIMIRESVPDIGFLEGMESLERLTIYADDGTWGRQTVERYQILDLGPIGNLSQLTNLSLCGFILKNVAALDKLDNLEQTYFMHSVLKDSLETSNKKLIFHPDAPGFIPVWGINEWPRGSE